MAAPLAVLDAGVVIFMAEDEPTEPDRKKRWQTVRESVRLLQDKGVEFVLPAPSIVELQVGGSEGVEVARRLIAKKQRLRIEALDLESARIAGQMLQATLGGRPRDVPRAAIKFDALIAAIAHAIDARYLVTTDEKDFRRYLDAVGSKVELFVARYVQKGAQTTIMGT